MFAYKRLHHRLALGIIHVDKANLMARKKLLRSSEIVVLANDDRRDLKQQGGAGAHHAWTQGTDKHQFIPVAAASPVADANNFGVGRRIALLDAQVMASGDNLAASVGENGADGQSALKQALLRLADSFCEQLLFMHGNES